MVEIAPNADIVTHLIKPSLRRLPFLVIINISSENVSEY